MLVTLSAVALFGILTLALMRGRYVGPFTAIAVFLFGFFTADTGAADAVRAVLGALADAARNIS
ncbi:hypothetical protein [Streptomyces longispororuber]|uniref:hypothetical protein n=1 Tax=Streptomyces longispororuber TaxID=68230 RepID=UPI00210A03A5|nr:hypothetical protein [Streptomyces longispororuber]MCQ4212373.1 hypothetical protein [Streptomyces longispororuber]